ncbi:hypothetical protein [Azospirillum largimobile]
MIHSYVPAILLLLAGAAALPVAVSGAGEPTDTVAAVFAPGTTLAEAMERVLAAGGTPLRGGPFTNIVVARSAHPDFAASLHQHGAWLLLDPLLAGCADLRRPQS